MLKDLRHAVRLLLHTKGWTSVVVLSLALGIGANTALFSAINGLLLTKIPVKDPDSLVRFRYAGRNDMVTRLGRTITPEDDQATAPPVAVISSRYWHSRFGTDPGVVGKTVPINDVLVTIVGVLSPEFTGIQQPLAEPPDVSLPLALDTQLNTGTFGKTPRLMQPTYWWLQRR